MFEVSVAGSFFAMHQLRRADGTLEPRHAHTWRVTAAFSGPQLDDTGILLDFTLIKPRLDELLAELYDRNLNDLPAFAALNPSAENVARFIAEQFGRNPLVRARLDCVEVEEAPGCVARYRPGSDQTAAG
jgi:6-pyruvoyltetrahydropterin/6-carboxytetrahydropterin synthase